MSEENNNDLFSFILSFKQEYDIDLEYTRDIAKNLYLDFRDKYSGDNLEKLNEISFKDFIKTFLILKMPLKAEEIDNLIEKYAYFRVKNRRYLLKTILLYFNSAEFNALMRKIDKVKLAFLYKREIGKFKLDSNYLVWILISFAWNPELKIIGNVLDDIPENEIMLAFDVLESIIWKNISLEESSKSWFKKKKSGNSQVEAFFTLLECAYKQILKSEESDKKNIQRFNQRLQDLVDLLNVPGEIKNLDAVMSLAPNSEVQERVATYILEHNNHYYQTIYDEWNTLRVNNEDNLEILFKRFGLSFGNLSLGVKQKIINLGYQKIEEILNWFLANNFRLRNEYLEQLDWEKVEIVRELLDKNLLTLNFVQKHLEIFFHNGLLMLITNNIGYLNLHGVNIINYANSLEVLFSPILEENLNILKAFNLLITRKTKTIMFLGLNDLKEKLELVIEMGLFSELSSLDILNQSFEELYRWKIFKRLNIPFSESFSFYRHEDYFTSGNIYLDDMKVEEKAEKDLTNTLPEILKPYIINNQVLLINGVYVSVVKLLANLSYFNDDMEGIYYAILKDSYYDYEEVEMLRMALLEDDKKRLATRS